MTKPRLATGVTLRAARLDDASELGDVHMRAWRWAYRGQLPERFLRQLDPVALATGWRRLLGPEGHGFRAWVAEVDGLLVGFAGSGPARDTDVSPGTVELYRLYMLEEFIGRGIGAALMRQAEWWWCLDGYASATAWVFASNERGRAFYARMGWRPDGIERELVLDGLGYPGVRLAKSVSSHA